MTGPIITATRHTPTRLPKTLLRSGSSEAGSKPSITLLMEAMSSEPSVAAVISVGIVLIIFPPGIC